MTVSQWMLGQFSALVNLKGGEERIFDDLMNNRRRLTDDATKAHLFKGSIKMKRLLDNYVNALMRNAQQFMRRQSSGIIARLGLEMSVTDLRTLVDGAFTPSTRIECCAC